MSTPAPINRDNVLLAVATLLPSVKAHLTTPPSGPYRVLEMLNALAIACATVIAGTGFDPRASEFFDNALNSALDELEKKPAG